MTEKIFDRMVQPNAHQGDKENAFKTPYGLVEKKESKESLEKALDFFEKKLLPKINPNLAGYTATRISSSIRHYYEREEMLSFDKKDLDAMARLARILAAPERNNFKNLKPVFNDEINEVGDKVYFGALPIAAEEEHGFWNDEEGVEDSEFFYHLRTGENKKGEEDNVYEGGYSYGSMEDYERFKAEIYNKIETAKFKAKSKGGPHEIPEELKELIERFKSVEVFPAPEGVDPFDWVAIKLEAPITKRKKGEVVNYTERIMDFAHGVRYGAEADYYDFFNTSVDKRRVTREGEKVKYGHDNFNYTNRMGNFDAGSESGAIVVHTIATQDRDSGVSRDASHYIHNVDVWPGAKPEEVADAIAVARYGKGADAAFIGALESEDAAAKWVEEKLSTLREEKMRYPDTANFSYAICRDTEQLIERKLFKKFPKLKEKLEKEIDLEEWTRK